MLRSVCFVSLYETQTSSAPLPINTKLTKPVTASTYLMNSRLRRCRAVEASATFIRLTRQTRRETSALRWHDRALKDGMKFRRALHRIRGSVGSCGLGQGTAATPML